MYPRTYKALKWYGFSPYIALTIIIDAMRGDYDTLCLIKHVVSQWKGRADVRN